MSVAALRRWGGWVVGFCGALTCLTSAPAYGARAAVPVAVERYVEPAGDPLVRPTLGVLAGAALAALFGQPALGLALAGIALGMSVALLARRRRFGGRGRPRRATARLRDRFRPPREVVLIALSLLAAGFAALGTFHAE